MTYELPRTESGEVDWDDVVGQLYASVGHSDIVRRLAEAIGTNAREEERERCARMCEELALGWDGFSRVAASKIAKLIRMLGDKK